MSKPADPAPSVAAGQAVFRAGEPGDAVYVIESGCIELVDAAHGTLSRLGAGEVFGLEALGTERTRRVSAVANESTRVLRIEADAFKTLLAQNPPIALAVILKLAAQQQRDVQRLAGALAEIARLQARPPPPRAIAAEPKAKVSAAPKLRAAPAVPAPAALRYMLRHADGREFVLAAEKGEFLVGRPDPAGGATPEIDLGPFDAARTLSRRHARLLAEEGVFFLREEAGVVNGTFVNGERIRTGARVALKPGDRLRFGAVEIEFVAV